MEVSLAVKYEVFCYFLGLVDWAVRIFKYIIEIEHESASSRSGT